MRVRESRWGRIEKVPGFPQPGPTCWRGWELAGVAEFTQLEGSVSSPKGLLREVYPLPASHLDK